MGQRASRVPAITLAHAGAFARWVRHCLAKKAMNGHATTKPSIAARADLIMAVRVGEESAEANNAIPAMSRSRTTFPLVTAGILERSLRYRAPCLASNEPTRQPRRRSSPYC